MKLQNRSRIIGLILILWAPLFCWGFGGREVSAESPPPSQALEKGGEDDWSVYPPRGWETDFREAYRTAQRENKKLLLNYTGSDWCVWCHRLRDEVLNTPAFKEYAEENLVLLFLDFPSDVELSEEQKEQNSILQSLLRVQGFPTVWLFDKDLTPLLRTGYQPGGAEEYIRHLGEVQFNPEEEKVIEFREGFRSDVERFLGPL